MTNQKIHLSLARGGLLAVMVLSLVGVFSSYLPAVYADSAVVTSYITEIKLNTRVAYRDPSRSDMLRFVDTLAQCLNNNWQTGSVTTVDQLKAQLRDNDSHPCSSEYTTVTSMRDQIAANPTTVTYPPIIREARSSGLTSNIGTQMRDDTSWSQKFEAYFDCLMTEANGRPNWQFGSTPPTTKEALQVAVRDNAQHPCHQARADLEAASSRPSTSAISSPEVTANSTSSATPRQTSSQSSSSTSGGGGLGADNRPIYDRIVAPNSGDVLTPGFAKQSNPSIGGLVNYLFDLLVRRILPLIVGVLVIVIIWAGFQYIMAQGDSGKTKQAKDTILFGIVGLGLALAALSIVTILNNLILHT